MKIHFLIIRKTNTDNTPHFFYFISPTKKKTICKVKVVKRNANMRQYNISILFVLQPHFFFSKILAYSQRITTYFTFKSFSIGLNRKVILLQQSYLMIDTLPTKPSHNLVFPAEKYSENVIYYMI